MIIQSAKLRKLRDGKRFSQQDVADKIGVSQSTYCEWEKKDSNVKLEQIIKLSEAFESEVEEFVGEPNTIKILNVHNPKNQNNAVIGYEVTVDSAQLYKDLIDSYKSQIEILKKSNEAHEATILELRGASPTPPRRG
jgi:transcriptional regulator with XRE-family HTH domain